MRVVAAAVLLALAAAACGPATGIPTASAQPSAPLAYPELAAGATGGDVFEYH